MLSDCWLNVSNPVVNRYVKSLHEVSLKKEMQSCVLLELQQIHCLLSKLQNQKKFLKKISQIKSDAFIFIEKLREKLKLSQEVHNFLKLLLENNRIELLSEICEQFFVICEDEKKVFHVAYAKNFTKTDEQCLVDQLAGVFSGKLECIATKVPSLIDGVKIQYRSKILDYSIKSKLDRLYNAVKGENYEN